MRLAQSGDIVMLVSDEDRQRYTRTLEPGETLNTHRGKLWHDNLIGQPLGSTVCTHLGFCYYLLTPTTDELIRSVRRESQIIFPKDAGYIVLKLGIQPGVQVVEAGTGSGGLTLALAAIVGDTGHVYSYDVREKMQAIAATNLRRAGLSHRVSFKHGNAALGFEEEDVDAVFLDMLTPWDALDAARAALRGSGVLGCLVPTINQLEDLVTTLDSHAGYGFVEVEELILRAYKPVPARIRPEDHIVGHTGYLVFARAVIRPAEPAQSVPPDSSVGETTE